MLGHGQLLVLFKRWITSYQQNNDNTLPSDWTAEFNTEFFDEFMIMESLKNTNINGTQTHAGQSITSTIAQTTSSSYNNIILDIKLYPVFNGQTMDRKNIRQNSVVLLQSMEFTT